MAFQLINDGVLREFRFYAPVGWPYWLERAFTEDGREGLPLVIALHGGLQDPEAFSGDWPLHNLINTPNNANWEDRFFVLYPHGFASTMLLNTPARGWNTGFSGDNLPVQNDVKFIQAAIDAVEELLRAELARLGIVRRPIDANRRFLFGYSAGGMMAYKLAHEMPNHFAAIWAMSAAFGGRSHEGLTPTITNDPQGSRSLSLFAHHGDGDAVVPPGPSGDPTGRQTSTRLRQLYLLAGLQAADADLHVASLRNLEAAVESFKLYNDCEPAPFATTAEADIVGGNGSEQRVFRQTGNPANPEVIVYRDPDMDHMNFTGSANRYFDEADVWEFFKAHPRL